MPLPNLKPSAPFSDADEVFMAACDTGEMTVVRLKIKNNPAIVNMKDRDGTPALHRAVSWAQTEVVEYLLQTGTDTALTDAHGENAASLASRLNYDPIRSMIEKTHKERARASQQEAFRAEMDALSKGLKQFTRGLGSPVKAKHTARFGKPPF